MPVKNGRRKKRPNGKPPLSSARRPNSQPENIPISLPPTNEPIHLGRLGPGTVVHIPRRVESMGNIEINYTLDRRRPDLLGENHRGLPPNPRFVVDMETLQKVVRAEVAAEAPATSNKLCLEYKEKGVGNLDEEDIEEISEHFRRVKEESERESLAKEVREPIKTSKRSQTRRRPIVEDSTLGAYSPTSTDPDGRRDLIATVALPAGPSAELGWVVIEGQWSYSACVPTYAAPLEWKVTELVGLHDSKIAILGRNGCGKTIVEIYKLMDPLLKLYEKQFSYSHIDAWQFGAEAGKTFLALGCEDELRIFNIETELYELTDIGCQVKGWGDKRVRALGSDGEKILIANDKDLIIEVFDLALRSLQCIAIQERVDCIWSITPYRERIYICSGISGEAFATDWKGRTVFSFRPPSSAQSATIPAVVVRDCDGFIHIFWLVKVDGSFRAVEFYYNVNEDKYLVEVRLDKKVKYMGSMKRPASLDPSKDTANGRTVVMTDEGDLYVSESVRI